MKYIIYKWFYIILFRMQLCIYNDVSENENKTNVDIEDLATTIKENRDRIYCMHLGDSINLEKIKKYGFRSVR